MYTDKVVLFSFPRAETIKFAVIYHLNLRVCHVAVTDYKTINKALVWIQMARHTNQFSYESVRYFEVKIRKSARA